MTLWKWRNKLRLESPTDIGRSIRLLFGQERSKTLQYSLP